MVGKRNSATRLRDETNGDISADTALGAASETGFWGCEERKTGEARARRGSRAGVEGERGSSAVSREAVGRATWITQLRQR